MEKRTQWNIRYAIQAILGIRLLARETLNEDDILALVQAAPAVLPGP